MTATPEHIVAQDQLVALGQVVNTHGIRGEIRLRPFNPDSTTLTAGCTVVLRRGNERQSRRVRAVRPHKQFLLLTLDGCDSMTAAEALVGYEVCVPETDLPPTGPHEIYHYQLIGMRVISIAGEAVGEIIEVLSTASHDICVVRSGRREHLIPFVGDIVKQVDRAGRRLVIEPPPGLLD